MMKARSMFVIAFAVAANCAFAQGTPRTPQAPATAQTPATPQAPAPAPPAAPATAPAPPAPAPPAPAPPGPPRREGQPINVKVELTIVEDGGPDAPIRKAITAVIGDGFSGYVREQATSNRIPTPGEAPAPRMGAPLNLDAFPVILPNGKVRLSCTIQYATRGPEQDPRRLTTEIKQNLVLNLESGKTFMISQATDPVTDRRVTVEVMATILK